MPMVAVSTVVGPLIEIPVMLTIVWMALRRKKRLDAVAVEPEQIARVQKVAK